MKTWLITSTSRKFSRTWTQTILERSDQVMATTQNSDSLGDLVERFSDQILPLPLNILDRATRVSAS